MGNCFHQSTRSTCSQIYVHRFACQDSLPFIVFHSSLLMSRLLLSRRVHGTQVIKRCLETQLESTVRYVKPHVLHELLIFLDVMDLHDQVDFDTRSYNIKTCDFTLMKFLLGSTFAAYVIFGHACHAKTVVVPRKIADSPLDLTKTACVVVPGCSVVAA